MSEEEKKPKSEEKPIDDFVPQDGLIASISNDTLYPKSMFENLLFRPLNGLSFSFLTISMKSSIPQEQILDALNDITIKKADVIRLDGIVVPEPDPKVISQIMGEFYKEFGMPPSMVQNFSTISQDAKPVSVDAVDVLMKQYKSLMEKAEAMGIKKGWVFCVPPELIPVLQAELKPVANESALPPIGGINQLSGIPIYAVHTESGQMEYMPYEVAMAKYGNQILPRERSSEDEKSED